MYKIIYCKVDSQLTIDQEYYKIYILRFTTRMRFLYSSRLPKLHLEMWYPLACVCLSLRHVQLFVTPWRLWLTRLLCPWNSPGKNTGLVVMPFSRGYSWPRDWTWASHLTGRLFTIWTTREAQSSGIITSNQKKKRKKKQNCDSRTTCTERIKGYYFLTITWQELNVIS